MSKIGFRAGVALAVVGTCAFVPVFAADLFFAGDSTLESCWVDGRKREPYRSWGDSLQRKLKGGSKVRNFARSGYSTKMFIERGAWKSLIAEVKAGDFVVIQFGHNDQKHTTEEQVRTLYAPPDGAYRENLRNFAAEVRAKGATPVFCTPIVRATFDDAGRKLVDTTWAKDGITLATYAQAVRETGAELGVDVVDMNRLTGELCEKVGRDEAYRFFVISTGLIRGKDGEPAKDVTHPIQRGADAFADLFCKDVCARQLKVAELFAPVERAKAELPALLRQVKSTHDGTLQPCYFYAPETAKAKAVPLVVGLHTWSYDWKDLSHYATVYAEAKRRGWAMVGPNFRGANDHPEACGSDAAVQDVVDAVRYAQSRTSVDPDRIYIIGGSGGGHMTLLMAGRHPEIWAGCAAFCPISDIARWHADSSLTGHPGRELGYAKMLEKVCGGTPAEKPDEYRRRSPLTWLSAARQAKVPVYIVTGIHDGWKGSVPVGHSFRAFNALAAESDRIGEPDIAGIEDSQKVPDALAFRDAADPFYGPNMRIHFRRTSDNVRMTLFEGGHGGNFPAGFDFLSRQVKGRPADFTLPADGRGQEESLHR